MISNKLLKESLTTWFNKHVTFRDYYYCWYEVISKFTYSISIEVESATLWSNLSYDNGREEFIFSRIV